MDNTKARELKEKAIASLKELREMYKVESEKEGLEEKETGRAKAMRNKVDALITLTYDIYIAQ